MHTNNGGEPSEYIPFSLEAALLSSSSITFDLHDNDMSFSTFSVYCECCKTKIYNESAAIHTVSDVMKSLPNAMFCHKLGHFIDGEKIQNYLFDTNFEYTMINIVALTTILLQMTVVLEMIRNFLMVLTLIETRPT